MKAVSLKQPHANRVMTGMKSILIRSNPTPYRGPLIICSGMLVDWGALGPGKSTTEPFITGHALATAHLVDCRPMTPLDKEQAMSEFYPGKWSWFLDRIAEIPPFVVSGKGDFFEIKF